MKEPKFDYIRIGVDYYKLVYKPLLSGDQILVFLKWNFHTLKQDGINIRSIKKFHAFTTVPSHLNFKEEINGFFNKYLPMEYLPKKGNCERIMSFLSHIFGDQLELGLDYLKILYEYPTQILPILCLVSEARNTGKTTCLNLFKLIFGGNMTINNNEDFRSQFNSSWLGCLIIAVDEAFLDKKEDSERIKNLATAKNYKQERKGVDRIEVEFFGKFILSSNNTRDFIKIDKEETRYWVREVPTLIFDNKDLLKEMQLQIPAFLQFLLDREFFTKNTTRMWFSPNQIRTKALDRVKFYNSWSIERDLIEVLKILYESSGIDKVDFTVGDCIEWLKHETGKKSISGKIIRRLLKEDWGLQPSENSNSYKRYSFDDYGEPIFTNDRGRFFTVYRTFIEKYDF